MTRFKTNMDDLEEEEKSGGGHGERRKAEWFKPRVGKNLIRILPPREAEGASWYKRIGYHQIGSGMGDNRIVCPKMTAKKPCPVCAHHKRVLESRGEEAAKPFAPSKRYLMNVLDMKAGDGQVFVWEAGPQLFRPIASFIREMEDDTMLDVGEGYNYKFTRQGERKNTKYKDAMVVPKAFSLEENGYDVGEIMEQLYDLPAVPWRPKEEDLHDFVKRLKQAVAEDAGEDGDDEDDEDQPRRRGKGGGGGRASAEVEDEEDDDAPKGRRGRARDEDDDDSDDEPPRKAKAKPARRSRDDDDDDGDPDEDDEPKRKPAKAAGKSKPRRPPPDDDEPSGEMDEDEIPF